MVNQGGRTLPHWLFIGSVLLLCAVPCCSFAAEEWSLEYKLKAVCIYKFVQFVEWPDDAFAGKDAPIVIGILGSDPFGPSFDDAMAGRTVNGRGIVIRRFATVKEAVNCQILYVSTSETPRLGEIMTALKGKSILTVGESSNFLQSGGVIRIYLGGDSKVHFEINMSETARPSKLKISSQLINLAKPQ